ncbi:two-component system sensor histidine kinase DesK [Brevibacterium sanguinis]|uniref:Two-component system sensor histidine kinase DesK n=2 Tax=Brevibacterium TaxID=1696 RepID=A0A366IMI2_9MICO|nr:MULTISPECIES: sensor histidine kinase [Brevibacterium]RBP61725.1 two-component system sensor histidine kinase DesK [Brevibacterium sanguinis]RBP74294.1 two-component system sensor histidine kinase DesK [Brevibacterium celere]
MASDGTTKTRAERRSASIVVLGLLLASFMWVVIIPVSLTQPPSPVGSMVLTLGMVLLSAAMVLVLHAAVSQTVPIGGVLWRVALLVVVTVALWLPLHVWAEPGELPWAWLAGFVVAACGLVRIRLGVVTAVVLGSAAVYAGAAFDSGADELLVMAGCALVLWLVCQAIVWLFRLLRAAQAGREAEVALAIAEERMRSSRELHDVLGHRLGVIALKAELAADLATSDAAGAVREMRSIEELGRETVVEARRAVHGSTAGDLGAQLRTAELVLASAGIETELDVDEDLLARLPEDRSRLLATVVREAVTNVLRHSDATRVRLSLGASGSALTLTVANDGARESKGRAEEVSGSGLAALAARCRASGARLSAGPVPGGRFELSVDADRESR